MRLDNISTHVEIPVYVPHGKSSIRVGDVVLHARMASKQIRLALMDVVVPLLTLSMRTGSVECLVPQGESFPLLLLHDHSIKL
jgi:hypothetical protein